MCACGATLIRFHSSLESQRFDFIMNDVIYKLHQIPLSAPSYFTNLGETSVSRHGRCMCRVIVGWETSQ